MKIITVIENAVYRQGLMAEHGLCLYIETGRKKILFDTGQSGAFMQNARTLGIAIEDIDTLVLSHGHYDHTGGLYPFLKCNSKAAVYAKRGIFTPKYNGPHRFIGTERNDALLQDRLVYVDAMTEIEEHVFIMPDIAIAHPLDTHFAGLHIKEDNTLRADDFSDELFIAIQEQEHVHILTACSHRGITNICASAVERFTQPLGLILGGFHMKDCTPEQYRHITAYLQQARPQSIGVCHCTGIERYAALKSDCDAQLFYNCTGTEIHTPLAG